MDFSLAEDQLMFQKMVRDFAAKEIEPVAARIDETDEFPAEIIQKMAGVGLMGLTIPEEYGGSGGGRMEAAIATIEIARVSAAVSTIMGGSLSLCCRAIYGFSNEEQKQRFVVPLAKGEMLGAFGLTEPGAGSDVASLETVATRKGDDYVLNGNKIFITNGAEAGVVVIFATLDRSLRHRGITAFVVDTSTPGFSVGKSERKMGLHGSSTCELVLDDCEVKSENRLGAEGQGFKVAMETIDACRIFVSAQAVGIAQGAYDAAIDYAKERQQFGQPIANFQAIQWMLADMATAIDAARLLTFRAAYLKDQGLPFIKEAAMAKVYSAEVAMATTTKAIQIHGGYGYTRDFPVERFFRDAKIMEIYEGTSEMQRMTISKDLIS